MSEARTEILQRIRRAYASGRPEPEPAAPAAQAQPPSRHEVLERFVEITADYRAVVERITEPELGAAVAAALHGVDSVVRPSGLPQAWLQEFRGEVVTDDGLTATRLDGIGAVVSASAVSISETGTIVLDHGPDQGRRAITLVPDRHVCVVHADQVVADVPAAMARLREAVLAGRPLTWISGPSATSDIELNRVEGVHGPRTLHVLLVVPSEDESSSER